MKADVQNRHAPAIRLRLVGGYEEAIMRNLGILTILLLLSGVFEQARAEDASSPESLKVASELVSITSPDMMQQLTTGLTTAFWPLVQQQASAGKIDDATVAKLRGEFERLQLAFATDALKDAPAIYARHFTVAELRQLIAFYRTPIGAKVLHEMPQVTTEFAALTLPRLPELQQHSREAFAGILREHGYLK
jgi:hypothetical protein